VVVLELIAAISSFSVFRLNGFFLLRLQFFDSFFLSTTTSKSMVQTVFMYFLFVNL